MITELDASSESGFQHSSMLGYSLVYFWAAIILIIFVAALFELGVFNRPLSLQSACRTASGYLCQNPVMDGSGRISFSFGQTISAVMYNVGLARAANSTMVGEPFANGNAFMYVDAAGNVVSEPTGVDLPSGSVISIHNLTCFDASGRALTGNVTAGQYASEVLWLNWTPMYGPPSALNPWLTTKFASAQVRVS